jgi:hypothetical protein
MNPDCITNTNPHIKEYFNDLGGVFNIGKSGAVLNEMRCKQCGGKSSFYTTAMIEVVEDFDDSCNNIDVSYISRDVDKKYKLLLNGETTYYEDMQVLIDHISK